MTVAGEAPGITREVAPVARGAVPLAEVVRGGLVESVHLGHLVVLDPRGEVRLALGEVTTTIWPRSSVKPLQAAAMVRAGLDLPERLLALAGASHDGAAVHRDGAREILAGAGLDESALQNTPDLPLDPAEALAWQRAGHGPEPITQNCSGKHAAMLATCVARGWDTATYRETSHPLQQTIRATVAEATGDDAAGIAVTVDGCGAPLFSTTLLGLARAFSRLAAAPGREDAEPGVSAADGRRADGLRPHLARVARAFAAHPELVAGERRDATAAMRAVPGLVAKDGADGVYAAGLPDGSAVAFKVLDGASRPRPAVLAAALRAAGALELPGTDRARAEAGLAALADVPVLGGGVPVGQVRAVFSADGVLA
ncbi:asparaginase [Isoptericola cucumis]|uniref:asparaginase n=1 Tax=Isoptericola cucumis TaxID=1776856 RepID=UPI001E4E89C2|nr:asparaginase [Isoptericola cucumis]